MPKLSRMLMHSIEADGSASKKCALFLCLTPFSEHCAVKLMPGVASFSSIYSRISIDQANVL